LTAARRWRDSRPHQVAIEESALLHVIVKL
jgi:hypothetical protein